MVTVVCISGFSHYKVRNVFCAFNTIARFLIIKEYPCRRRFVSRPTPHVRHDVGRTARESNKVAHDIIRSPSLFTGIDSEDQRGAIAIYRYDRRDRRSAAKAESVNSRKIVTDKLLCGVVWCQRLIYQVR